MKSYQALRAISPSIAVLWPFNRDIHLFDEKEYSILDEMEPKPLSICRKGKCLNTSTGFHITDIFPEGLLD